MPIWKNQGIPPKHNDIHAEETAHVNVIHKESYVVLSPRLTVRDFGQVRIDRHDLDNARAQEVDLNGGDSGPGYSRPVVQGETKHQDVAGELEVTF